MAEEASGWESTCERYVAFLDIMGFRDMVFRESHEKIKEMFECLRPTIESIRKEANAIIGKERVKTKNTPTTYSTIFPISFSDSIILFSSNNSNQSALLMIVNVAIILSEAMKNGVAMKGSIAYGEMTAEIEGGKSLYFGKPLIDAFELQQEVELYSAVLHHTAEKALVEFGSVHILDGGLVKKYFVPMKSGKINHYTINWDFMTDKSIDLVNALYEKVSGKPRKYVDNTLDFIHCIHANEAELAQQKK